MSSRQAAFRAAAKLAKLMNHPVAVWSAINGSGLCHPVLKEGETLPIPGYVIAIVNPDGSVTDPPLLRVSVS